MGKIDDDPHTIPSAHQDLFRALSSLDKSFSVSIKHTGISGVGTDAFALSAEVQS